MVVVFFGTGYGNRSQNIVRFFFAKALFVE